MKRLVCLILLLSAFAAAQEKQKLPEGAMTGDFRPSNLCVVTYGAMSPCPPPKLVVPVEIWATGTLINRYGESGLSAMTGPAFRAFWYQNGVEFVSDGKIHSIFQDGDPSLTARSIPRKKGAILIFLSHQPFDFGLVVNVGGEEKRYRYAALSGAGWIDLWIDPWMGSFDYAKREGEVHKLVHELGHIFGLKDSDDELSVMCSSLVLEGGVPVKTRNCNASSIYFNGGEITRISGVLKVMKKSGFEPYEGLSSPVESYEVYDVKTTVKYEVYDVKTTVKTNNEKH